MPTFAPSYYVFRSGQVGDVKSVVDNWLPAAFSHVQTSPSWRLMKDERAARASQITDKSKKTLLAQQRRDKQSQRREFGVPLRSDTLETPQALALAELKCHCTRPWH